MKRFLAVVVLFLLASPALAVVVPNDRENTPGTGVFLGPLTTGPRTYQLLIDDTQLTSVVGMQLTAITWRLPTSATSNWPAADVTYTNFDIRLSDSVEPANRSLTFADNIVGPQTLVRAGSLTVPAESFQFNSSPNPFGHVVAFDTPYNYSGGNLLIELRHTGHGSTSRSVDAVTTGTAGYGTLYSAAWQSSYTATSGLAGNAVVTNIVAVPEPATLTFVGGSVGLLVLRRRRA